MCAIKLPNSVNPKHDTEHKVEIYRVIPNPSNRNEVLIMISESLTLPIDCIKNRQWYLYRYNMVTNVLFPAIYNGNEFCPIKSITNIFYKRCKATAARYGLSINFAVKSQDFFFDMLPNGNKDSIIFIRHLHEDDKILIRSQSSFHNDEWPWCCTYTFPFFCIFDTTRWVFTKVVFFKGESLDDKSTNNYDKDLVLKHVLQPFDERHRLTSDGNYIFIPILNYISINDVKFYKNFVFGLMREQLNCLYCWKLPNVVLNGSYDNNYNHDEDF